MDESVMTFLQWNDSNLSHKIDGMLKYNGKMRKTDFDTLAGKGEMDDCVSFGLEKKKETAIC
jgi:hypothetical protein